MTTPLRRGQVSLIDYRCTTPGPEVEEGVVEGYWTGEIDTWGKLTIVPVNGTPPLYLFRDEIVAVEDV